jgi:NAD(P)-dependent dehydrogenase (short-subunit alcohol dehydrogenase family)
VSSAVSCCQRTESRTVRVGQDGTAQPTRDRFRRVARFRDRVAIVAGAGAPGGIGAAVARGLVAEGGRVVLGATSERASAAAELGDAAFGVIADLTVDGAADSLVRAALDRWGRRIHHLLVVSATPRRCVD